MKIVLTHGDEEFTYDFPDLIPNQGFTFLLAGKLSTAPIPKMLMKDTNFKTDFSLAVAAIPKPQP